MRRRLKRGSVIAVLAVWLLCWAFVSHSIGDTINAPISNVLRGFVVIGLAWASVFLFLVLWLWEMRSWLHRGLVCLPFLVLAGRFVRLIFFPESSLLSVGDFLVMDVVLRIGPVLGGALPIAVGAVCLRSYSRRRKDPIGDEGPLVTARSRSSIALVFALLAATGLGVSYGYTKYVGEYRRQHPYQWWYIGDSTVRIQIMVEACQLHSERTGEWPATLQELVNAGYLRQRDLVNPRWPRRRPGYFYFRPRWASPEADPVVACDAYRTWPEGGVVVCFASGHSRRVHTEEDLRRILPREALEVMGQAER